MQPSQWTIYRYAASRFHISLSFLTASLSTIRRDKIKQLSSLLLRANKNNHIWLSDFNVAFGVHSDNYGMVHYTISLYCSKLFEVQPKCCSVTLYLCVHIQILPYLSPCPLVLLIFIRACMHEASSYSISVYYSVHVDIDCKGCHELFIFGRFGCFNLLSQ